MRRKLMSSHHQPSTATQDESPPASKGIGRFKLRRQLIQGLVCLVTVLTGLGKMNSPSSLRDGVTHRSQDHYIVWMYPFSPPTLQIDDWEVPKGQTLVCPYKNACQGKGITINMAELTEDTFYHSYILDHTYHKLRHMKDFCHHIHAIAMISLLIKKKGACVQTLGGSKIFCSAGPFNAYNPYENGHHPWSLGHEMFGAGELSITQFPFGLLDNGAERSLSLAPDMTSEQFATYGPYNISEDLRKGGRYNSGEDIQSMAAVGWYPFVSSIRDKTNALANYSGYYIANSLQAGLGMAFPYLDDAEERRSLMEKLEIVSMFIGVKNAITTNSDFLDEYTTKVYPFGCRSTVTCQFLKDMKIRSYFSACLTLTSTYQGSILKEDGSNPSLNALPFLNPTSSNFTSLIRRAQLEKNLIIMVDVTDPGVIPDLPPDVKSRVRHLSADIPPGFPRSVERYSERIDYCYRLLSQYKNHAKVIITSRIHVGLPAAALGIPVIFVSKGGWLPGGKEQSGRVAGLLDVFHRVDNSRGMPWKFDLSKDIPPNPGNHEADRYRASFWNRLKRVGFYADAARLFGRIPLKRLGAEMVQTDLHSNFHFVLYQADLHDWRSRRAVEAVLFFHPNSKVTIHTINLSIDAQSYFSVFAESGYDVSVQALLPLTHHGKLKKFQSSDVNSMQMLLGDFGGVFLSKSTFIRGALSIQLDEGYSFNDHGDISLMIRKPSSTGSLNVTAGRLDLANEWSSSQLSSAETERCMTDVSFQLTNSDKDIAITLDQSSLQEQALKIDTECFTLIEHHCIYCDDLHWVF